MAKSELMPERQHEYVGEEPGMCWYISPGAEDRCGQPKSSLVHQKDKEGVQHCGHCDGELVWTGAGYIHAVSGTCPAFDGHATAPTSTQPTLTEEKRCCTVCDAKKQCSVCGNQSLYACSDCQIDFGVTIYVCPAKQCRDEHETKCSARLCTLIISLQADVDKGHEWYRECAALTAEVATLKWRDAQSRESGCWCDEYGHPCKGCEVRQERDSLREELARLTRREGETPDYERGYSDGHHEATEDYLRQELAFRKRNAHVASETIARNLGWLEDKAIHDEKEAVKEIEAFILNVYRDIDCSNCGRHRVQSDGVCEKCLWDIDNDNYASITRPDEYNTQGRIYHREDENSIL